MPNVYIAITVNNGSVAVMEFVTASRGPILPHGAVRAADDRWTREPTDENIFAELLRAFPMRDAAGVLLPQPISYKIVAVADLPGDRAYRNAWTFDGTKFGHDIVKAREVHRNKIRKARTVTMAALDGQWMRAMGLGDAAEAARIEVARQRLRDAPADPRIEAAATVEELKAIAVA